MPVERSECHSHAAPTCGKGNARVQPRQGAGPEILSFFQRLAPGIPETLWL
uniref:AlNc14C223G9168 protein n=1 Tax=Albugo laibachii Nc14 TaxID=890382 RepID=F0WS27_9STRA|nr:AlNc14C223G9168 [Albugo laibachii Nc14]|eukprot:CCA24145.1 AlNc14C223G9168 [Albugo laibachii Nc14]